MYVSFLNLKRQKEPDEIDAAPLQKKDLLNCRHCVEWNPLIVCCRTIKILVTSTGIFTVCSLETQALKKDNQLMNQQRYCRKPLITIIM